MVGISFEFLKSRKNRIVIAAFKQVGERKSMSLEQKAGADPVRT